jgi:DNA polymerase-3 subunit alpha
MVGVINNFGGFYKTEFYFNEARRAGARIEAPCVNRSEYLTSIEETTIFIGFIHLKSLEQKTGKIMSQERGQNGPYKSMEDFVRRIPAGLEQINILIRIGAFRFTGISKRELLWNARILFGKSKEANHSRGIFDVPLKHFKLPPLESGIHEDAFDELELLGFPLCDPFDLLEDINTDTCSAPEMLQHTGKYVIMTGYLVTTKHTHTKTHQLMHFGTFLDRNGYMFDSAHFPDTARKHPFRGKGFYRMQGKIAVEFGFPMLEVSSMRKLSMVHKKPELTQ